MSDYRDPNKKPAEGMIWSEKFEMWIYPDTRTPERKAKDEAIAQRVEKEREERRDFWKFVLSRFAKGWPAFVACGNGWRGLILKLTEELDRVWEGFDPRWEPTKCWSICQIKEKFAGLRYYADPSIQLEDGDSEEIKNDFHKRVIRFRDLIHDAEMKSYKICETCGKEDSESRTINGWLATLCDEHYKEAKNEKGKTHEGA